MDMRVRFDDMRLQAERIEGEAATAVTRAAKRANARMERHIRDEIAKAFGSRTAKSWKGHVFPKQGASLGAAAYHSDRSKGGWVIRSLTEAGPISGGGKKGPGTGYLAIPTEAALAMLPKRLRHGRGAGKDSGDYSQAVKFIERKYGELNAIFPRGLRKRGVGYLVVEAQATTRKNKAGERVRRYSKVRRVKSGDYGRSSQTVIMFVLVRRVRRAGRFDLGAIADRYADEFARDIVRLWPEEPR